MSNYLVATIKPWNLQAYHNHVSGLPGNWHLVGNPELLQEKINEIKPRYIFFPHWSWLVPDEIINNYECVCFHMTDVPYGRGGSPLQNLISRGRKTTVMTAMRMVKQLDAGPVYMKRDFPLAGTAQEIYERAANIIYDLIGYIIKNEAVPEQQQGEPTVFSRRNPQQSALPRSGTLEALYDHIRMLDAETYPHASLEYGKYQLKFTNAELQHDELVCQVVITRSKE